MKGPKKLLSMIGVLVLLVAMLVPAAVFADEEGTATGTFSNNNIPSITSVELWTTVSPAGTTAMTPQVKYDVQVKVTDVDGLTDLTTIVVKIYKDTDASADETEFGLESADTKNCAVITWTQTTDLFSIEPSADTSWGFTETDCVTGSADSGTAFQFQFTVGKVATEAAGVEADCWRVAALVTDDSSDTDFDFDADNNSMAWYGEISGLTDITVDWGTVNPGMDFGEDTDSEEAVVATINYISNGAYDEQVKSSTPWTSAGEAADADLAIDGTPDVGQEFALKADDDATLTDAVVVIAASGVAIDETGAQTLEAGDNAADNTLWLKLNATFAKDVYSGTITYIIANGS